MEKVLGVHAGERHDVSGAFVVRRHRAVSEEPRA